ncbi:MAG: sialidase family protein, partial [Thermoplasmata archaeon]
RVHFAYLEYDCGSGINLANTTDGAVWEPVQYLAGSGGLSDKESVTVDPNGRLYLAWDEAGLGNEMQVTWSDDGGATWAPFENPASSPTLGVVVATSPNGTVYLTWWNLNADDIMFDWSSDGGVTWHPDVRVNSVAGFARAAGSWQIPIPAMNVDPGTGDIYIAWPDSRNGNQDIYLASSSDGGQTWSTNVRFNDDSGSTTQYMVDLAIDSAGTVHAAWEDKRSGAWNIFYSNSTDSGQTWIPNLRVSSEDTPGSYNRPGDYFAIEAGPNDYVYVVWTDGRGDDFDIYYARNPGFPAAVVTITTEPEGLPVVIDNVSATAPVQRAWPIGSVHTVGVVLVIPVGGTARYVWTSWSDGGAISHVIVAEADRTITASFTKQYLSRVRADPVGVSVLVDGLPYPELATFWWDEASVHSIEAPSPQPVSSDARYAWSAWSDGGARAHTVTAIDGLVLTATFIHEEAMRVSTSPEGLIFSVDGVLYSAATTFWFEPDSYHIVSAPGSQPGPGTRYSFDAWSDGGPVTHAVPFGAAMSLEARFSVEYYLNVTSSVSGARGGGWYPEGVSVVAELP